MNFGLANAKGALFGWITFLLLKINRHKNLEAFRVLYLISLEFP